MVSPPHGRDSQGVYPAGHAPRIGPTSHIGPARASISWNVHERQMPGARPAARAPGGRRPGHAARDAAPERTGGDREPDGHRATRADRRLHGRGARAQCHRPYRGGARFRPVRPDLIRGFRIRHARAGGVCWRGLGSNIVPPTARMARWLGWAAIGAGAAMLIGLVMVRLFYSRFDGLIERVFTGMA